MKTRYTLGIVLILGIVFSGCGESQTKKAQVVEQKTQTMVTSKNITLTTLEGQKIELSFSNNILVSKTLNGKITLVNFFATWCPPCIEEIPMLNKLYEEHGDIFEIVAVLYEKNRTKEEIVSFAKEHNIKFPITLGDENFEAAKMFDDVKKIPESFLFTKEGFLFEKYVGVINEKVLEDYLKSNSK
jgi:thiol-disulfide isomerase/thioredoxin